jgi:hypothetical protein
MKARKKSLVAHERKEYRQVNKNGSPNAPRVVTFAVREALCLAKLM